MGRAFVFSLDAFVALMLILIAINSAIALYSAPKGYYSGLEQAHDLAKDTLLSMRQAQFSGEFSYLDAVLIGGGGRLQAIANSAEKAIPMQFGYRFDRYNALTNTWEVLYDSATEPSSPRLGRVQKKLSASYRLFISSYDTPLYRGESPFCYVSCSGVPIGLALPKENANVQAVQVNFPSREGMVGGGQGAGEMQNEQVNFPSGEGVVGAQAGAGGNARKTCMSPCDAPWSFYDEGTPFIGQVRLTVYS